MNEDAYQRLSRIHDELMQLCHWLNEKRNEASASRLIPIPDDLRVCEKIVYELSPNKGWCEIVFP